MKSARSSCKGLFEIILQGSPQDLLTRTCARSCSDFTRISTIFSHKDPLKFMQGPLAGFHWDLIASFHKDLCKTLVKSFIYSGLRRLRRAFHRIHRISLPESQRNCKNQHRATARGIRHGQSAERSARAISKFAPRNDESDPTRTK